MRQMDGLIGSCCYQDDVHIMTINEQTTIAEIYDQLSKRWPSITQDSTTIKYACPHVQMFSTLYCDTDVVLMFRLHVTLKCNIIDIKAHLKTNDPNEVPTQSSHIRSHLRTMDGNFPRKSKRANSRNDDVVHEEGRSHVWDDTNLEDEDAIPIEFCQGESSRQDREQDRSVPPSEQGQKKRCRGQTKMEEIHARKLEDRVLIILNEYDQPIGPNARTLGQFSSFLGTVARFPQYCPLDCVSWRQLTSKDDMWEYVKMKWLIPEEGKEWVLSTINSCWRRYKIIIKDKYIKPFDTDEERLKNLPSDINEGQFRGFLKIIKSKRYKNMTKNNTRNRMKQKDMHTTGRTSFAFVKQKLKMTKENHELPSKAEMFLETRKRVAGRDYKADDSATQQIIARMEEIQRSQPIDNSNSHDMFSATMPKEHPGRVQLEGRAVMMTDLKNKALSGDGTTRVDKDFLTSLAASVEARMAASVEARVASMEAMVAAAKAKTTSAEARIALAEAKVASVEAKVTQIMTWLQSILPDLDPVSAARLIADFLPDEAASAQKTRRSLSSSTGTDSPSDPSLSV